MTTKFITPNCCKTVKETKSIILDVDYLAYIDGDTEQIPKWYTHGWWEVFQTWKKEEASFCPHCGTPVPEIEPAERKAKICTITDGGYYCDTCTKRLGDCRCLPVVFRWRVKKCKK